MNESSLTELVNAAKQGDTEAWHSIVSQFENLVWHVVRGFRMADSDACDAAQVVWLKAVERLSNVREPERLGLWLSTIARRECLRIIERKQRLVPVDFREREPLGSSDRSLEHDVASRSEVERVIEALAELSTDCQQLLRLVLVDPPMAYRDISELLGIAVGTIGPRRMRCLSTLRSAAGV